MSDGMEITQLVGGGASESWSAQRVVTPLSEEESAQTGSLLLVINVTGDENNADKGTEIVEELVTRFQTEAGFPRSEWIKRTKDFLMGKDEKVSVSLAVIWKNTENKKVIYITGVGDKTEVRIERSGKEINIWPTDGQWSSGYLKDGDRLVMATESFWRQMWGREENLNERIEAAREKIAADESGTTAAVIAEIEPEELSEVVIEKTNQWPAPERNILDLKPVENVRRKWLFRIGGIFLVLLLISVGLGMWRKTKIDKQNQYNLVSQPIRDQLTEAEQIMSVNPTRARDLMTKAKQTIESTAGFETGEFAADWKSLSQKVEQQWQTVSGEKQIESKNWFDLSVIKEGMTADQLVMDGMWIEILDKGGKLLGAVNLKDKSSQQLLAGSNLDGVVGIGKGVVLTGKGLIKINPEKKSTTNIFEQMDELSGVSRLSTFAGNVYTMDATDLWKFPATDSGLGNRRRYFGVGVTPSLSEMVDMWVDGDVWIVTAGGDVSRYSKGVKVSYTLNGWTSSWGSVKRIETTENEVFIWDKQNGIVVVFDRESGDYKRKLINDNLKSATDLVLDEEGQRVIMAVEGKLMEMSYN